MAFMTHWRALEKLDRSACVKWHARFFTLVSDSRPVERLEPALQIAKAIDGSWHQIWPVPPRARRPVGAADGDDEEANEEDIGSGVVLAVEDAALCAEDAVDVFLAGVTSEEHPGDVASGHDAPGVAIASCEFKWGKISYYANKNFECVCNHPRHVVDGQRCRLTRTSDASDTMAAQGRPLGLMAAWLTHADRSEERVDHRNPFCILAFSVEERQHAREALALVVGSAALFACERERRPDEPLEPSGIA